MEIPDQISDLVEEDSKGPPHLQGVHEDIRIPSELDLANNVSWCLDSVACDC